MPQIFSSLPRLSQSIYVIHVLITDVFVVVLIHLHIKYSLSLHFHFFPLIQLYFSFFFYYIFFYKKPEEAFENGIFFPNNFFQGGCHLPHSHSQSNSCKDKHTSCERCGERCHHMAYRFLTFPCVFLICLARFSKD